MESTIYDLKTAKRIAYFGAIKMDGQGYEIKEFWGYDMIGGQLRGGGHLVRKGLTVYEVRDSLKTPTRHLTCTCPFYEKHGACKHQVRVGWLVADAEETALRDAEEDAWADEAMARMEALEGLEGDALTRKYGRA